MIDQHTSLQRNRHLPSNRTYRSIETIHSSSPQIYSDSTSIYYFLSTYKIERDYKFHNRRPSSILRFSLLLIAAIISFLILKIPLNSLPPLPSTLLEFLITDPILAFLISRCLYLIFNIFCCSFNSEPLNYFFRTRSTLIFMSFFIETYSLLIGILGPSRLHDLTYLRTKDILSDKIPFILSIIRRLLLLWIMRRIIIDIMNYSIYVKHHKQRVIEEKMPKLIIQRLSMVQDGDITDDLSRWAHTLYLRLMPDGGELTKEDFRRYLGPGLEEKAMEIFDLDNSGGVSEREFKSLCVHSITNLINLKNSILGSEQSVKSIDTFLIIIITVIIFFYIKQRFLSERKTFTQMLVWFGVLLGPLTILFTSIMVDILLNINTFFILRPFDIGDTISINNKTFISKQIGIFSSVYKENNMEVHCFNKTLQKKELINFRKSQFEQFEFIRRFKFEDAEKIDLLEKKLNIIVEGNQKCFVGRVLFKDYKIEGDIIVLSIRVCFRMRDGDVGWYLDNRGEFSLILAEEISKLGIGMSTE
ncbi:Mechanosensitive ion channel protein 10 [Cucumispora dikerogammari]|nr:Mechanosensitive ion channel protein 10 [Cucumispora dikerogammari]